MKCSRFELLPELLPCAHCGSHDVSIIRSINTTPSWHVECLACGMRTADYTDDCIKDTRYDVVMDSTFDAIECCVTMWNERAGAVRCDDNDAPNDNCAKDNANDNDETHDYLNMGYFMNKVNELCDDIHSWCNNYKRGK